MRSLVCTSIGISNIRAVDLSCNSLIKYFSLALRPNDYAAAASNVVRSGAFVEQPEELQVRQSKPWIMVIVSVSELWWMYPENSGRDAQTGPMFDCECLNLNKMRIQRTYRSMLRF